MFSMNSYNFKMNKNIVKYLQGIRVFFPSGNSCCEDRLDICHAVPDLFISQPLSSRKFNPAVHARCKWWSGFVERNALLDPFINYIILLAITLS